LPGQTNEEKACLFPTGYGDKINEHLVGFMPCKTSHCGMQPG